MAYEQLKQSTLAGSLSAVLADLSDLIQKEMRLARAEISEKLSTKLRAGVWMTAAGLLGLIVLLLLVQAAVFGLASYGIAPHWACLIVALAIALAATMAYYRGRAGAQENLMPTRAINQIKQDIATTKEHLS
jgi:O-antigen/teichoic acid export membrane protein